jgi:DNA-binding MarR family transcriptional regulator
MERNEDWDKKEAITIATLRSTIKRTSCMRILEYLTKNSKGDTVSEIAKKLEMEWETVKYNLVKLAKCGFLEIVRDDMDGRTKYYYIADKKATEKALELYHIKQRKDEEWEKRRPKSPEPSKNEEVMEVS